MEHLHPDDRNACWTCASRCTRDGWNGSPSSTATCIRLVGRCGSITWPRVAARDAAGRAIRTFGVLRDITERKRAEEALRQSYAEIEQLKDRLQAESDYLKAEIRVAHPYGEVTGQSAAIQKVLRQVEQVAPTDSSVLVRGETGTGKELVAQAIHRLSPRAEPTDGQGQLRRASVRARGERALRPGEGRLHRGA